MSRPALERLRGRCERLSAHILANMDSRDMFSRAYQGADLARAVTEREAEQRDYDAMIAGVPGAIEAYDRRWGNSRGAR